MNDTVGFWRSEFGDEYTARNRPSDADIQARAALWAEILDRWTELLGHRGAPPQSILEVGANVGQNVLALQRVLAPRGALPRIHAVEPNQRAREVLLANNCADVVANGTAEALPFADGSIDLVFTSGVLIHIPPNRLRQACSEIHRVARHYVVAIEYFSSAPAEKVYRGHAGRLWTRDFGSFYADNFEDLRPLACGFAWKRMTGLDNLTWWLFDKWREA